MSVTCGSCGLFNSFSFVTSQRKCIRCGKKLDEESIFLAQDYRENMFQRDFRNKNPDNEGYR